MFERIAMPLAITAALCVGCAEDGPAEEAGEKIDEAVENTGDAMEDAADDAEEAIDEATDGDGN